MLPRNLVGPRQTVLISYSSCSVLVISQPTSQLFFDDLDQRNKALTILLAADEGTLHTFSGQISFWYSMLALIDFSQALSVLYYPSACQILPSDTLDGLPCHEISLPPSTMIAYHFCVVFVERDFATLILNICQSSSGDLLGMELSARGL